MRVLCLAPVLLVGLVGCTGGASPSVGADASAEDAGLREADASRDAGRPTASSDAGPPDAAVVDAAVVDAGPADGGRGEDAGPSDAGASDSGPSDSGALDAGTTVAIVPAALPPADACQTVTVPLSVSSGLAVRWRVLTNQEVQESLPGAPYAASIDPISGVFTLGPTGTLQGATYVTGVEVTLTSGPSVRQAWSLVGAGVGSYAVSQGGPAIFSPATLPDISRSSPGGFASMQVALPIAQHPCTIRYVLTPSDCSGTPDASAFLEIDAQGTLRLYDASYLALATPGTYCLAYSAEFLPNGSPSGVFLDHAVYTVNVVP